MTRRLRSNLISMRRRAFTLPLCVALLVGLFGNVRGESRSEPATTWWRDLDMRDTEQRSLASPTQPLVLVFLDTECPIANGYLPVMNALAAEFASRGISFLGVYTDPTSKPGQLEAHRRDFKIGFATADDRKQRLVRFAGATYSSEVVVLDSNGSRLYRGRIDDRVGAKGAARPTAKHHDLREVLLRLCAGEPGPFPGVAGFGCAIAAPVKHP